jgi:hypothetical protein
MVAASDGEGAGREARRKRRQVKKKGEELRGNEKSYQK